MLSFCDLKLKKDEIVIRGVFLHNDEQYIHLFTRNPGKWSENFVSDSYVLKIPIAETEDVVLFSPVYLYERFTIIKQLTSNQKEMVRTEMKSYLRLNDLNELLPILDLITVEEACLLMLEVENKRYVKRAGTLYREAKEESMIILAHEQSARSWMIGHYMEGAEQFQEEFSSGSIDLTEYRNIYYNMTIEEIGEWQSTLEND